MTIPTTSMKVPKVCPFCGVAGTISLTQEQEHQYQSWDKSGRKEFIQDGLWTWTPEMREMLITGIDSKCWSEKVLGDTEENEVEI